MNVPSELLAKIDEAITHYPVSKRSASLPLLHLWQEHFGHVSEEGIAWIAAKLELSPHHLRGRCVGTTKSRRNNSLAILYGAGEHQ